MLVFAAKKKLIITIFLCICFLTAGWLLAVRYVNKEYLTSALAAKVKEELTKQLGRPVEFSDLKLTATGRLEAKGVRLGKLSHEKADLLQASKLIVEVSVLQAIRTGDLAGSIAEVKLVSPKVWIGQDSEGNWNYAGLLGGEGAPGGGVFQGSVAVENGTIVISTLNRVQEEIFLSKAWVSFANMPLLGIELAGKWEDFPLAIRGNLDLERKKSDLAGQTLEAVSIVDLLDAIAQRGYNLYWGDIKAGRAKLNFRLWDSQLATAFDLFGAKAQFMVGGEIIAGRWQPPGWQVPVQRLDGRFSWDTSSKELVLSDVRAKLSHILAQGEGSIIFGVSPLFDVKVRAQGEIAEVFDIYPHWRPRGLEASGYANAHLAFHGTTGALRITGTADLEGGTVYYPGLGAPIKGIRGKVAMDPNKITVEQLQAIWHGGSFTLAEGYLTSPWSVPRGAATVTVHSFKIPGSENLVATDGKASIRLRNRQLFVEDLAIYLAEGKVVGSGVLDFRGPEPLWQAELSADNMALASFEGLLKKQFSQLPSLGGQVSGTVVAKGERFAAQSLEASAQLELTSVSAGKLVFPQAEGNLFWDGTQLTLNYFNLYQGSGKLAAAGKLVPKTLQVTFTGEDLPVAPWAELFFPEERITGKLNLVGQLQGTAQMPVLEAQAELVDSEVAGQKIQMAQGTLRFQKGELSTTGFTVRSQGAVHRLKGSIATGLEKKVDLKWQLQGESLERILAFAGVNQPVAGQVAGQIELAGSLSNLSASGMVNVLSGQVGKQHFDRGSFFFTTQGEKLILERASLEQNGSRLAAAGTIGRDGTLNLMVIAPNVNLASLTFIPQEQLPRLAGKVSFQGLVGGKLTQPTLVGELTSQRLTYDQYVFQELAGKVVFSDQRLEVEAFKLKWLGADFVATGELIISPTPLLDLQLQLKGVPLGEAAGFLGWQAGSEVLAGYFDGLAQLSGPLDDLKGEGYFSLREGKLGSLPIGGRGELVYSQGALQLHSVSLTQGRGTVQAAGLITSSGLSLKVDGQDLDLAVLSELAAGKVPKLAGKFSLDGEVMGDYADPKILADLTAHDAKMGALKLGEVVARLQLEEGIVRIDQLQVRQNGGFLSLTGTLPLTGAQAFGLTAAFGSSSQTDLDLKLENIDLRLLAAVHPDLETLSGRVSAQLKLIGRGTKPELHGRIDVKGGSLSHSLLGGQLKNLTAALIFYGDQMVVEELKGNLGGGTVQVTGGMKMNGLVPESYDLFFSAGGVHYNDGKMVNAILDGNLRLSGDASLPKVSGLVEVSQGRLSWAQMGEGGEYPFDLLLDIKVATKDQAIFRYENMLNIWFQGEVQVGGTLSNLALSGQVTSQRGTFSYLELSFNINEATADFYDYRGIMPILEVQAASQVEQYTIRLQLSGPVENLNFSLSSTPELSQEEILALLGVTGRIDRLVDTATGQADWEAVMQDELLRFLDTQFRSQFVSGFERRVEEFLGIDEFRLEPNLFARDEKMEIRLSKQLSDRAVLSYQRTLELRPKETFELDWRILPSFQLKGQWDDREGASLSLETKFRF